MNAGEWWYRDYAGTQKTGWELIFLNYYSYPDFTKLFYGIKTSLDIFFLEYVAVIGW